MRASILSLVLMLSGGLAAAASTPASTREPSAACGLQTVIREPVTPLTEASESEREAIEALQGSLAWTRRVMALLRLQRFDCPESAALVADALHDRHAAVRCFALLVLGHRGVPQDSAWLETETEPTVIRTALRTGFHIDPPRLSRGIAALARSSQLPDKLLAAELALLSEDPELHELATELVKIVILRMDDQEAGALSPRLARITASDDLRRGYRWRNWWKRHRRVPLQDARILPPRPPGSSTGKAPATTTASAPESLSAVAALPLDRFLALADHLETLALEPLDLAIVLDCTASMSGEIADAQGGVDDLMRFVGDVTGGIRIAVAGYRDRRERFEKIGWDFTPSIDLARSHLWKLNAEGGGDRPELVDQGLRLAYERFSWDPRRRGTLVLVGDAPPHPGRGTTCIEMATDARRRGVTTHVVGCDPRIQDDDDPSPTSTDGDEVEIVDGPDRLKGVARRRWSRDRQAIEFFPEIAAAGGGRVVNLTRDERLVPEIAGLVVGTDFEEPMVEFFQVYMALCR